MIDIAAGKSTPRILMDYNQNQYLIEGQSYPENSSHFYEPLIGWVKENVNTLENDFLLKIKLIYLNTSSTKAMLYLFDILDEAFKQGNKIQIEWYYDRENEMARETGEELLEDLALPYSIIEV